MNRLPAVVAAVAALVPVVAGAGPASGTFKASSNGSISPKFASAYIVRDSHNPRTSRVELILTDVPVDVSGVQSALDPHMVAINLDALRDRNYVLLWVAPDGHVSMNATFSKTMTQYANDTTSDLKATFTTNTPARVEGRLFSSSPLKTMDGTAYSVDLKFAADVVPVPSGTALPAGGGAPGKALSALLLAAQNKNWPAIKAAAGPAALKMFDHDYNSPAENAAGALDLLKAWIPLKGMKITGGQLRSDTAIVEVEGDIFGGQRGLSLVKMVNTGTKWQFESAALVGMLP